MGFGQKSLMRRHVTPMVREGRLVRRSPDRPDHRTGLRPPGAMRENDTARSRPRQRA